MNTTRTLTGLAIGGALVALASTPALAGEQRTESFEARFPTVERLAPDVAYRAYMRIANKECGFRSDMRNLSLRAKAKACRDDLMDKAVLASGSRELASRHGLDGDARLALTPKPAPTAVLSSVTKPRTAGCKDS